MFSERSKEDKKKKRKNSKTKNAEKRRKEPAKKNEQGKKKYKTKIGKNVFVGSDTQFVAPISVGDDAVIGSGSTITKDVPAKALAVARGKQFVKENYVPKTPKQEG